MATLSMTGFGQSQSKIGDVEIEIEAKSVNHRYLDVSLKLPQVYSKFEADILSTVKGKLDRGRIDILISRNDCGEQDYEVSFNSSLFNKYLVIAKEALQLGNLEDSNISSSDLLALLAKREVVTLTPSTQSIETERKAIIKAVENAIDDLIKMRKSEGEALERELLKHLSSLEVLIDSIKKAAPNISLLFKERLEARLEKLDVNIELDQERLANEVAYIADRTDVTEELARLDSHIDQFKSFFKKSGNGRKLEFLLQEMVRESNTIGSKAQNSDISSSVVEIKALLEKLREQILNLE